MGYTRFAWLTLIAATLAPLGCGDDGPYSCRIASQVSVPATQLSNLADVRIERVGETFVLVGADPRKDVIRFARVAPDGTLSGEAAVNVPPRKVGPWYALTGKNAPGDQLTVVYGIDSPSKPGQTELQVITVDLGAAAQNAPKSIIDGNNESLHLPVLPTIAADMRASMGTTKDGMRAAFAWGFAGQSRLPDVLVLKTDGQLHASPSPLQPRHKWDCLAIVPSRTDFAVSTIERSTVTTPPFWHLSEMNQDGSAHFVITAQINARDIACPVVAPATKGYIFAFQNSDGTYYGAVDSAQSREQIPVRSEIVKGAVRFGGPQKQPPVACVADMGQDYGMAYQDEKGPLVDRFDYNGDQQGRSLYLPSHGRPGPISGWPTIGAFHLTYLDQGASGKATRMLVQVDCPARK